VISEEDLKGLIAQEGESLGILEPAGEWTRCNAAYPGRLRMIAGCLCEVHPARGDVRFRYVVMHRHVYATYADRELFSFFCGQCECGRVYWAGPYPATEAMLREF
jgi:hypothetical protein